MTTTTTTTAAVSAECAHQALTEHRHYAYRGCAPDVDEPGRAAGDLTVPVTAWEEPDVDGGEPQKERARREAAAKRVCGGCPVQAVCRAYANSLTADGKLAEPFFIRGGQTALERHKDLIAKRHEVVGPAPRQHLLTEQKQRVLVALASHRDAFLVADAAGVDLRTANWQRASLVRLLGLPRGVSRMGLLEAARERGVLAGRVRMVVDDGSVPAIPRAMRAAGMVGPGPDGSVGARAAASLPAAPAVAPAPAPSAARPVKDRVVQLSLWEPAEICSARSEAVEAAA